MPNQILNKILENTFTAYQLRQKISLLKSFIASKLYQYESQLSEEVVADSAWLSSLGPQIYSQFNPANFTEIFDQLEKSAEALPCLVIYFAIEPNLEQIEMVGQILRKNYGPTFIFEPKYDPSLIGGCVLVWKGIYKDFSLRAKIAQKTNQILEVIKQSIIAASYQNRA